MNSEELLIFLQDREINGETAGTGRHGNDKNHGETSEV